MYTESNVYIQSLKAQLTQSIHNYFGLLESSLRESWFYSNWELKGRCIRGFTCNRRYSTLTVKSVDGTNRIYWTAARPSQNTCTGFQQQQRRHVIIHTETASVFNMPWTQDRMWWMKIGNILTFKLIITSQAMYVQRNIKERRRNSCCRGKAIIISYPECVSIALGIQRKMHMGHIVICGPSGCNIFSTISHKR